jgi:hypothetical protein
MLTVIHRGSRAVSRYWGRFRGSAPGLPWPETSDITLAGVFGAIMTSYFQVGRDAADGEAFQVVVLT